MAIIQKTKASIEWETPREFFQNLDDEFYFTLDPCATEDNAKCDRYYTVVDDGLTKDWTNEVVYMNPPYGRELQHWVAKACKEKCTTVMLIPARTDTWWFHELLWNQPNIEIRFLRGRKRFVGSKHNAPFPSMIVVVHNGNS